ncbi:MAG: hypothetical protein ISS15_09620 [Alphaproteobacteria bacterium]|nr:hypothetical protein [Alphaproteobacteria bacterium]MBL7097905.1 hypothetical protein [Alphaproteobacteria bacterium]
MTETDLKSLRVLIVGGKAANVQILRTAFGLLGIRLITAIQEPGRAVEALRTSVYGAIFCDAAAERFERMPFHVAARRAAGVLGPMTPLFIVYSHAHQRHVEQARDAGVTDVLTHPVSAATIARKLEVSIKRPRNFIAAATFFGPDRRTDRSNTWYGHDRRKRIAKKTRILVPDAASNDAVLL